MFNAIAPGAWISLAVGLGILYAARSVVTPLLCAYLAAFMIEPLVAFLEKKAGRTAAVILTLIGMASGLILVMVFLVPKAVTEAVAAAQAVQNNVAAIKSTLQSWLAALPDDTRDRLSAAVAQYGGKLVSLAAAHLGAGLQILSGAAEAFAKALLFLVGFIFLMLDFPLLKPGLLDILNRLGVSADRVHACNAFLVESGDILRAFFRGQLLYALALGAITALGLWAIRLPYGLTIGISVGILSLIPYVGVGLGLVVALAVSFYSDGRLLHLALTAGVFGLTQFVDAVYLTPKFLGGSVGLHPLLAVVALLAFSQLFGFFGVLLAIPLAAITLAAIRRLLAHPN